MNFTLIKLLLQLKNASLAQKEEIKVIYSNISLKILSLLYIEGLIQSFKAVLNKKHIKIFLRFFQKKNIFEKLKIMSTPSKIIYLDYKNLCKISDKQRTLILTTNKNLITGVQCKQLKIGGILFFIC